MSIFVTDSFTAASDELLDAHVGELGATWTNHPHANYTGPVQFVVDAATDRLYATQTDALYASGVPPSADYYSQADFHHVSTISQNVAVCVRMDTTADTMYLARLDSGTTWHVRKIVAGAATTLGTSTNNVPSAGNFKTGKLVVQGDQLNFYINGVLWEVGPITDSAITATGRAGVRNAGIASASTGMHLDNFEAGDLTSPATPDPSFQVRLNRPAMFLPGIPR